MGCLCATALLLVAICSEQHCQEQACLPAAELHAFSMYVEASFPARPRRYSQRKQEQPTVKHPDTQQSPLQSHRKVLHSKSD